MKTDFNNKVAVTGANGFIGAAIVQKLLGKGVFPICVDIHNNRCPPNCLFVHKNDFISKLKDLGVYTVLHQGACSDTMNYQRSPMMKLNYEYTKRLYDACNELKISLIYASSAAVYGMGDQGFSESLSLDPPHNVYGESKLLVDQYVASQNPVAQVVGLRYFNVYGSDESHKGKMASAMFHFYNQVKQYNQVCPFVGSENFYRDFVYIDDVVAVNLFFMKRPHISGIFNVGTGIERSFLDIANTIRNITNCSIEFKEFPKVLKGRYQKYTCADISKLRSAGYDKEFFTLEQGIKDYWYKLP